MPPSAAVPSARTIRPFLKWAGGKRQLLGHLRRFVPDVFRAYHEPFLGSGALFFDLWRRRALAGVPSHLSDANADLIGAYQALARDADAVLAELRELAGRHERDGPAAYYRVRDDEFNPRRRARAEATGGAYPASLAAMFIYLNRTGYNGLFRLNASGDFNVPAGRYAAPRICDEAALRAVADVLRRPSVTLEVATFLEVRGRAVGGDLVYFDPPYAPLSDTARFTAYTRASFGEDDQRALHDLIVELANAGCQVILSNSTAPVVTELYAGRAAKRAGLRMHRVPARRAINSVAARRGIVEEYVISNVRPTAR